MGAKGIIRTPDAGWWHDVSQSLSRTYKDRRHFNKRDPLAELVFIKLTLQTGESRYLSTYASLRKAFPTWSALRRASAQEIAEAIRDGGLSKQKADHISDLLQAIKLRTGRTSLHFLHKLTDGEAEAFLCSLPGVGVKTARCVLLYSLGRQTFPIDIHCWTILQRLGIVRSKAEKPTHTEADEIQEMIPPALRYSLHVNMVSLGRDTCLTHNPRCGECCLLDYCETGQAR